MPRLFLFALLLALLSGCATPVLSNDEGSTPSPTPTETPIPTKISTPTETPTATNIPLPQEFLTLVQEHGFPYKIVDGKVMVDLVDGSSVAVDPKQMADWPMWDNKYLVVKGDNGIPQYRYTEGKGWESVEQTSMIDAFGNNVLGWIVETSPVWDDESTVMPRKVSESVHTASSNNLLITSYFPANVKQWKLLEFMASDGNKMQSLQIDSVFNNGNQVMTVRGRTFDVDGFFAPGIKKTVNQIMDLITPGNMIYLNFSWGKPSSSITPQNLANIFFGVYGGSSRPSWVNIDNNPFATEISSAMNIGQIGANKFPESYLTDILSGKYGTFVDLSQDTLTSDLQILK